MLIFSQIGNLSKVESKFPEISHGRILSILKPYSPYLLVLPYAALCSVSLKLKIIQERLGALVNSAKSAQKSGPTSLSQEVLAFKNH